MPFYEYFCKKCDKIFTITMSVAEHEKKKVKCPECKGTNLVPQFRSFTRRPLERAKLYSRLGPKFCAETRHSQNRPIE